MSNEGKIINRVIKTELVEWRNIKDLQPTNFKAHFAAKKVKESILKWGFSNVFSVWECPKTQQIFFVDGHTRNDILFELVSEGYEVPDKLPCQFLEAKDRQEAAKLLLQIFNQKQAPILEEGLVEFVGTHELTVNDLVDLDLNLFVEVEKEGEESEGEGEGNNSNAKKIVFEFDREKYDFVSKKIENLITFLSVETKEDVIIKLLENNTN